MMGKGHISLKNKIKEIYSIMTKYILVHMSATWIQKF